MKAIPINIICIVLVFACTNKSTEAEGELAADESGVVSDTTTSTREEPIQSNESEGSLIIHGKDIWVRDFPNTGKVVMTLNEGNVCKILQVGRYDVIRGKGSHWYQIDFNGKTGWVFGSQTDKRTEEWEVLRGSGTSKYSLNNIQASDTSELFLLVGKAIKKTETIPANSENDAEPVESISVGITSNSINADWSSGQGAALMEEFKKGMSIDMLQLWNYHFMMGAASMIAFDNTIVVSQKDGKCSIVTELPGKEVEILRLKNSKYLIVTKHELFDMGSDQKGFMNFAVYNSSSNSIVSQQQLGFSRNPMANLQRNAYYVDKFDFELDAKGETIQLTILEEYSKLDNEYTVIKEGKVKRFFQFNESKNLFEEIKQEEVIK